MDSSPTIPENTDANAKSIVIKSRQPVKRTPCGYAAGGLRASDSTQYQVLPSGQIVRRDGGGLSKAEKKAAKRKKHKDHRLITCATGGKI